MGRELINILELFKDDERIYVDGEYIIGQIQELALKYDEKVIMAILNDEQLRKKYFININGTLIFKREEFVRFIGSKEYLQDSYTKFKNKIGLTIDGKAIKENKDVVLSWPYKDCVLEGGQDTEDSKRDEVFYNEILASDDIDRLLDPKVMTNFKRYDEDGESINTEINEDDNLIIKGNNLVALSSLLPRYEGKVKLIYIDPPYYFDVNKKEDTFAYNSNFKLSTWLTFMKNRLEIARELLSDDGAIFVQISDDGVGELHCLMKEVFNKDGENNFINKITVRTKSPSGFASVNAGVFETAEYILSFAKNKKNWTFNHQYIKSDYDDNYKWIIDNIEDHYEKWDIKDLCEVVAKENGFVTKIDAVNKLGEIAFKNLISDYALKNRERVFRYTAIGNNAGQEIVKIRDLSKSDRDIIYKVERENHYDVYIRNGNEIAFYQKKVREIDGELAPSIQLSNIWTDTPYEGIAKEGNVTLKGGKKPEKLIKRIIEMSTNKGDIVLDYHLGSGTTCAVAHKLGRQYIGIEQLDYGSNDSVTRLNNVIDGDSTGISKSVDWQGGGSFVYCELMKWNEVFIEKINKSTKKSELEEIWNEMKEKSFLSYRVKIDEVDKNIQEFKQLKIEQQKEFLLSILDKNHLYVNLSEIEDEVYGVSDSDKELNKGFYKCRKECTNE